MTHISPKSVPNCRRTSWAEGETSRKEESGFDNHQYLWNDPSGAIWYRWKGIFKENPTPYVTKDEDYSLWTTSTIIEIAPLGSFQNYRWLSNTDFSFLDFPPSTSDL